MTKYMLIIRKDYNDSFNIWIDRKIQCEYMFYKMCQYFSKPYSMNVPVKM